MFNKLLQKEGRLKVLNKQIARLSDRRLYIDIKLNTVKAERDKIHDELFELTGVKAFKKHKPAMEKLK